MIEAIAVTKEGLNNGETPFGAVIVKDDRIVARTHNQVWSTTDITAHAEVTAIREACKNLNTIDLSGCVIYSTCEPCPMCFSAIHWANIDEIIYGADIDDAKRAGFNELEISNEELIKRSGNKLKLTRDFMKDECSDLFDIFVAKNDKRVY